MRLIRHLESLAGWTIPCSDTPDQEIVDKYHGLTQIED